MAAPTPTARAAPAGIPLDDGYQTLITLEDDTDIEYWEKTGTPPAYEGGDAVDTTTMHNSIFRTKAPRQLIDVGDTTFRVAYDPVVYTRIQAVINVKDTITITYSDGSTLAYFGYLKSFTPAESSEGTQPEADIVIVCTNWDPVNNVEEAPVMTEVAGT